MVRKMVLGLIIAVTALVTSLITTNIGTGAFASNGQDLAPGQGSLHNNPSNNQPPPGNPDQDDDRERSNPGQCQKFLQGPAFDADKDAAHDFCFD